MPETRPYRVLLYYLYTPLDDPEEFAREHRDLCERLGLLGRILIAHEGINGTVSGPVESTDAYIAAMHADKRFAAMQFKIDAADGHVFRKLIIKVRPEIVRLRLDCDVDPRKQTGKRLSPREFREMLDRENVVLVDGRNIYEYEVGHFRGAIRPDVKTFRDFPTWVRETLAPYKAKTVLTYCTGGIRCEKLSGYLIEQGFRDVYQLDGGIVTYGKDPEVRGELFDGSCYVFDQRATVPVNQTETATVVGRCHHCDGPCERFVNCANLDCDNQYICCVECELATRRSCSESCKGADNHEFDPATAGTLKSFYR